MALIAAWPSCLKPKTKSIHLLILWDTTSDSNACKKVVQFVLIITFQKKGQSPSDLVLAWCEVQTESTLKFVHPNSGQTIYFAGFIWVALDIK